MELIKPIVIFTELFKWKEIEILNCISGYFTFDECIWFL